MPELLADRFLPCGAMWIDVATGAALRIRIAPAPPAGDAVAWNDWCATLALLRHPALNTLVDYGYADAAQTFEAYTVSAPLAASGTAGTRTLTHAARFLEASGIHLRPGIVELVVRQIEGAPSRCVRRPFGVVLQPRHAIRAAEETLAEMQPAGPAVLTIEGERGAGLRTAWLLTARIARLQGYLPVSAALLGSAPWLAVALRGRHVCVLIDGAAAGTHATAASLAARLGVESARRHVVIRFERRRTPATARLPLERLGVTAMMSMVFKDRDYGPDEAELLSAARESEGYPGRFLSCLRATAFPAHRPAAGLVHETAPAYLVERNTAAGGDPRGPRGRSIVSAEARAVRLAGRGRHAAAIRLLSRAARVLEARGQRVPAAGCAERLGWILRDRGRTQAALEQFARASALAEGGALGVRATIGTGVAWTDECRFAEAEAALRSAAGAAELLEDSPLQHRALIALARCLHWQQRHDEASVLLAPCLESADPGTRVAARALTARLLVATGDLRPAIVSAGEAVAGARGLDARARATAARAMALVQRALGDVQAAKGHIDVGLAAATAAHVPLLALRLRAMAVDLLAPAESRTPVRRRPTPARCRSIPPLVALQLETSGAPPGSDRSRLHGGLSSPAVESLQQFLEMAHTALDESDAIDRICAELCTRLRTATVQIVSGDADRRPLARAGRPWVGDLRLVERAIACRPASPLITPEQPHEGAHTITYTGQPIAVLACRWTVSTAIDAETAASQLCTASLALAPAVRAVLDRAQSAPPEPAWRDMIGVSPPALALRDGITRAARAPFPVLVEGESGSGKELVARAVHRLSARRDRRFCAVNCAAISDELLEAELFGHARGAFTGAVGERAGLVEEADGGTLFLDEVGELSPRAQAKLLRVLQDGEVRRVGENFARRVDARVIAATNRRLGDEVESGRFRADLWFRLDVVRIRVPPLRDRPLDIPLLAAHFWDEAARRVDSRASLAPETTLALTKYDWPGNVRQLQNVIAALAVHAPRRGRIPPSLLPAQFARTSANGAHTFEAAREEFERRYILAELARAGGQRARAARALGVTRQGLAKMMRRLGIDTDGRR